MFMALPILESGTSDNVDFATAEVEKQQENAADWTANLSSSSHLHAGQQVSL
jgi:hypothetical protein